MITKPDSHRFEWESSTPTPSQLLGDLDNNNRNNPSTAMEEKIALRDRDASTPSSLAYLPSVSSTASSVNTDGMVSTDSVSLYRKTWNERQQSTAGDSSSESQSVCPSEVTTTPIANRRVAEILSKDIWNTDLEVLQTGLNTLVTVARQGSQKQKADLVRYGCISSMLRLIEVHDSEKILVSACRILEMLADERRHQTIMGELGGLVTISRKLKSLPMNRVFLRAACRALDAISLSCQDQSLRGEGRVIPTEGTVHILSTCMTAHPKDMDIQSHSFSALANMCIDRPRELQELVESGAIIMMTQTLSRKWKSTSKKNAAVSSLAILLRQTSHQDDSTDDEADYLDFEAPLSGDTDEEDC